jgi:hypothetical protein
VGSLFADLEELTDAPWFCEEKDRDPASEFDRQTAFLAKIHRLAPSIDVLAIPNAGKGTDWERVRRWREGARRGALDLVITWNRGVMFAEFKDGTSVSFDDLPRGHYRCILADPPWHFRARSAAGRAIGKPPRCREALPSWASTTSRRCRSRRSRPRTRICSSGRPGRAFARRSRSWRRGASATARSRSPGSSSSVVRCPPASHPADAGIRPSRRPWEDAIALAFTREFGGPCATTTTPGAGISGARRTGGKLDVPAALHYAREIGRRSGSGKKAICKASVARGAETFAQADPTHAVTSEHLGRDPWLLGTPKGTLNLAPARCTSRGRATSSRS